MMATLLAESERDMKILIKRLKEESEKMGKYPHVKKTKILTTSGSSTKITIDNENVECIDVFICLGSMINQSAQRWRMAPKCWQLSVYAAPVVKARSMCGPLRST
ncbi:uncharacterized protein LOC143835362 [Paroedura picta]|uniref:uncharacterized protein LOC143835362 n=1 Tax=Paroedura picta TaxID=143630 RepID=UPI00405698D1